MTTATTSPWDELIEAALALSEAAVSVQCHAEPFESLPVLQLEFQLALRNSPARWPRSRRRRRDHSHLEPFDVLRGLANVKAKQAEMLRELATALEKG